MNKLLATVNRIPKWVKIIAETILALAIGIMIAWMLNANHIHFVNGSSMEPTYHDGQILFGSPAEEATLEKGMVVVALTLEGERLIKRVVGCPGDTISLDKDGTLVVNGEREARGFEAVENGNEGNLSDGTIVRLNGDDYYLMGDNRNHSSDSRYYGTFNKTQIMYVVEKALF